MNSHQFTPPPKPSEPHSPPRILRAPAVVNRCGIQKSSIYAGIRAGTFPPSVRLSARAVGWRESDIEAWIASRTQAGAQAC